MGIGMFRRNRAADYDDRQIVRPAPAAGADAGLEQERARYSALAGELDATKAENAELRDANAAAQERITELEVMLGEARGASKEGELDATKVESSSVGSSDVSDDKVTELVTTSTPAAHPEPAAKTEAHPLSTASSETVTEVHHDASAKPARGPKKQA